MKYLRQLRNDEKRSKFATIATIDAETFKRVGDIDGLPFTATSFLRTAQVPGGAHTVRFYAIVVEAFAAGSVLDWGYEDNEAMGAPILADLDLAVKGESIALPLHSALIFESKTPLGVAATQQAIDSAVGKVQLVVEYIEAPVRAGCYSA